MTGISTVFHSLPQFTTPTVEHSPRPTTTVSLWGVGSVWWKRGNQKNRSSHTHSPTVQEKSA